MLKVASINIEKDRHKERVCAFVAEHRPDVVMLQELLAEDADFFARRFGLKRFAYCPAGRHGVPDKVHGLGIFTHLPLHHLTMVALKGSELVPVHDVARETFQECVLWATVTAKNGTPLRLGTTHLYVTDNGMVTSRQMRTVGSLVNEAERQKRMHGGLVLTGDMNAPRGRMAFDTLARTMRDHVPLGHDTSLDPKLHRAGHKPQRMVDGFFSFGTLVAEGVELFSGVSDHQALLGVVRARGR